MSIENNPSIKGSPSANFFNYFPKASELQKRVASVAKTVFDVLSSVMASIRETISSFFSSKKVALVNPEGESAPNIDAVALPPAPSPRAADSNEPRAPIAAEEADPEVHSAASGHQSEAEDEASSEDESTTSSLSNGSHAGAASDIESGHESDGPVLGSLTD